MIPPPRWCPLLTQLRISWSSPEEPDPSKLYQALISPTIRFGPLDTKWKAPELWSWTEGEYLELSLSLCAGHKLYRWGHHPYQHLRPKAMLDAWGRYLRNVSTWLQTTELDLLNPPKSKHIQVSIWDPLALFGRYRCTRTHSHTHSQTH